MRVAFILAIAALVATCLACARLAQLPQDRERDLMAAQLGIAPSRLRFEGDNPLYKLRPGRAWLVMDTVSNASTVAHLETYRSALRAYYSEHDEPRGWLRPPGVRLPKTSALTSEQAIAAAKGLVAHFWPEYAAKIEEATVRRAGPDHGAYVVSLELPRAGTHSPGAVLVRLDPGSGACEVVDGFHYPGE